MDQENVRAEAVPIAQTEAERILELDAALLAANDTIERTAIQLNDAMVDLTVMRDRFTEELNAGNRVRAENMKLKQSLGQQ